MIATQMTEKIFKTLALPVAAAMMLLQTTACSNEDNPSEETASEVVTARGYAIPVTVDVSRQGDNAATRATYDTESKKLSFSEGDQLFIYGTHDDAEDFAGTLTWTSGNTFEGTVYTESPYSGTCHELFSSVPSTSDIKALLLPAGYESYGYINILSPGTYNSGAGTSDAKAFVAGGKALGVEQLSFEDATGYADGFVLAPQNAVMACTISGLAASTTYTFTVSDSHYFPAGSVTTDANGTATFCAAFYPEGSPLPYTIRIGDGTEYQDISLGEKTLAAGHVYNVSKLAIEKSAIDVTGLSVFTYIGDGTILTGTYSGSSWIRIEDGATVTLKGVDITNTNNPGLECDGSATIILVGENKVTGGNGSGIHAGEGSETTLTITGTGSLVATGSEGCAGIGAVSGGSCGNITISGGTVTAKGGASGAGIGMGHVVAPVEGVSATCGAITITGGTVTATGGEGGAGIGTGRGNGGEADCHLKCGNITISGGTVTATGGDGGAGIGTGDLDVVSIECGAITIKDGVTKVTATKTGAECSIGMGTASDGTKITIGSITIGGTTYWNGSDYTDGDAENYLKQSTITYQPSQP